jgi:Polysaccharide lyase
VNRSHGVVALLLCGLAACGGHTPDQELMRADPAGRYQTLYATDWADGIDASLGRQAATADALSVVADPLDPTRYALQASIARDDDFSHVANGSPRAELVFSNAARFEAGRDYVVRWTTLIPASFEFGPHETQLITQIHQGTASGPPPIMLTLSSADYTFSERGGEHTEHGRGPRICCAPDDRGKWVHWTLRYVPDSTGLHAVTQLWKDAQLVYEGRGAPNAYPDDRQAYLKIGLYKPGWQTSGSSVDKLTILYGPLSIGVRAAGAPAHPAKEP